MTALTMQSFILTKIVQCMRDCMGIIAGVQHIDRPLEVKYWGVWTPMTPAALTPMGPLLQLLCSSLLLFITMLKHCLTYQQRALETNDTTCLQKTSSLFCCFTEFFEVFFLAKKQQKIIPVISNATALEW